ncbi:MAG: hypothetical protein PVJ67_04440 [Candidatus Pacearchaeota archaeon]|jgi:hypothetical protein
MHELILANKEIFKIAYALVIGFVCAFIVFRTDRLFHLSFHNGIRYFRNAFFFYGIAFFVRYILGAPILIDFVGGKYSSLVNFVFEFFLVMAGFFLLYSLLWKRIEKENEDHYTSLLNRRIFLFYVMSAIIAVLDFLWATYSVMFVSQVALFFFASLISYNNYIKKGGKRRFLKFYFLAMVLSFLAWLGNTFAALYFNWDKNIIVGVYLSNIIIFLLFLYGVVKITRRSG